MSELILWFQVDPRRLCVLGVWLNLFGAASTFYGLMIGAAVAPLLLGIALTVAGTQAKIAGRDGFKRLRLSRHRLTRRRTFQTRTVS